MTTTTTMAELPGLVGTELGTSDWYEVTQDARAPVRRRDRRPPVDPRRRRAREGRRARSAGPIAHGYLTLSLLVPLVAQVLTVSDTRRWG